MLRDNFAKKLGILAYRFIVVCIAINDCSSGRKC